MSEKSHCCCQKPEKMKTKPEQCSPKQIEECHGPAKKHPCPPTKQVK